MNIENFELKVSELAKLVRVAATDPGRGEPFSTRDFSRNFGLDLLIGVLGTTDALDVLDIILNGEGERV